jgi:hypothetical protein
MGFSRRAKAPRVFIVGRLIDAFDKKSRVLRSPQIVSPSVPRSEQTIPLGPCFILLD